MSPKERNKINGLFPALRFLTTLPLSGKRDLSARDIGRSLVYFPVVGMFIGAILSLLNWLLHFLLPASVVSALTILSLTIITGALHLDGFIDTCDGMVSHKTAEERLAIMKDSHIGAFGAVGAILLLLTEYVSLNSLSGDILSRVLLLFPVVGRWTMVYAIFACPYARAEGLGRAFKENATTPRFILATVITLAAVFLAAGFAGFLLMASAWLVITILATYLKSKLGGLTGDSYGAINEVAEVSVLITTLVLLRLGGQNLFSFM